MEYIPLNSELREGSGKGVARKLRAQGRVPAILYGHKEEPVCLSISELELKRLLILHPESAILNLAIGGDASNSCNAIVREVQRHPTSGSLLHVDLQRIDINEKVRVQVPIVLKGDARGVKEMGGILEHGLRELNITCIPRAIPSAVEIDVTELGIGDSIHVRDIASKYTDFELLDDEDTILANVVPPKVEVTPVIEEEAPEEPELVAKEKEEAEEGTKGKESKDTSKQG